MTATTRLNFFSVFSEWRVIFHFVDIGEIVDHHCLKFFFKRPHEKGHKKQLFLRNGKRDWIQTVAVWLMDGPYKVVFFYVDQESKMATTTGQI